MEGQAADATVQAGSQTGSGAAADTTEAAATFAQQAAAASADTMEGREVHYEFIAHAKRRWLHSCISLGKVSVFGRMCFEVLFVTKVRHAAAASHKPAGRPAPAAAGALCPGVWI